MEWTETLCRETGIRFLTTRPSEIEAASFAIIKEELGEEFLKTCPQDQLPVLCRVIHTTADFSYKESLYFSEDAVSKGPGGPGLRHPHHHRHHHGRLWDQ